MKCNRIRSAQWTVQNNKNTNYISNITQGHTYGKKRRNKNKMCNEIKKCKTIRCAIAKQIAWLQTFFKISSFVFGRTKNSYRFGTTWGWVNDRIYIFWWTIPLRLEYTTQPLPEFLPQFTVWMSLDDNCWNSETVWRFWVVKYIVISIWHQKLISTSSNLTSPDLT